MSSKVYINGISGISAQTEEDIFNESPKSYYQSIFPAIAPNYKEYIDLKSLRRMSKAVKMGITASKIALNQAKVEMPDAIITGTGQGCKLDTEKFLTALQDQDEQLLTPTSFIQSTHNTVGGQIALLLQCNNYNITYSQNTTSLESALIDAQLQITESEEELHFLIGGVDEISERITNFQFLDGQLKLGEIHNLDLMKSNTEGTITSEGAHFFVLSNARNINTYSELIAVQTFNGIDPKHVETELNSFLKSNQLNKLDIDLVMLGYNGDVRFDSYYDYLETSVFTENPIVSFKQLVGDFPTVTGFAIWLACLIFKHKTVPNNLHINSARKKDPQTILIYNQYLGKDHSFILLKKN